MRYRKLDSTGDMLFGHGAADFWVDQPEGVAQSVATRLGLYTGDWWLDLSLGTPYRTQVLGVRTDGTRDMVMRARVAQTPGVQDVLSYASQVDRQTRTFTVQVAVDTVYGPVTFATTSPSTNVFAATDAGGGWSSEFDQGLPVESTGPSADFQVGFAQP